MIVDKFMSLFLVLLVVGSKSYQDFNSRNLNNRKVSSLPEGYTLQANISMSFKVGVVLMSPDQKWIMYTKHPLSSGPKNMIYIKSRNASSKPVTVVYSSDQEQSVDYCQKCIKFSQEGDLLFFGTNRGILYMCSFSVSMTSQDCQTKIDLNTKEYDYRSIDCIDVNRKNQVALVWNSVNNFTICIVRLEDGKLVLKDSYLSLMFKVSYWIKWHPIDQEMVISLSFFSISNLDIGQSLDLEMTAISMNLINTISRSNSTLNVSGFYDGTYNLDITSDGQIIFVSTDHGIYPFSYAKGQVSSIGQIYDTVYEKIHISADGKLITAYRPEKSQIELLAIQKTTLISSSNKPSDNHHSNLQHSVETLPLNTKSISVNLQYLTKLSPVPQNILSSSIDNNLIIVFSSDPPTLYLYALCPNQTYLSNADCLPCSDNCSNCHFNQTTCTNCPNNSYALETNVCYPCFKYISNCSTCLNQSTCLSCLDFYFLSQSQCKPCDIYGACKSCASETNCTLCDSTKGYDPSPINSSSCQCRHDFSYFDHKCVSCIVSGCELCEQSNKCKVCDSTKGFNETSTNGTCQCQQNFSELNQTCVQCSITGCIECQQTNKCSSCNEKDYDLSPEGKCVEKQNSAHSDNTIYILIGSCIGGLVLIGIIIGVYYKCKQKQNKVDKLIEQRQGEGEGTESERSQIERSMIEQRALRSIVEERVDEHVIRDQRQKVKYSDEERMRLKRLQGSSLISN